MNNQILPQHTLFELSANHNGSVKRADACHALVATYKGRPPLMILTLPLWPGMDVSMVKRIVSYL